ncbi:MAG TPA: triacylglycerol lipase [Kofleriaceae bacterium]|nr:triacylglycerol lipase [Kofleriaceae bacterium]
MRIDRTGRTLALSLSMALGVGCAAMDADEGQRAQEAGGQPDQGGETGAGGAASEDPVAAAARTPLPIVLLHGAAGFDQIGPLEYFFHVADDLTEAGHVVFTTEVDPLQTIDVRAGELAEQIDAILAETGAERVHLIGHSQGGLDARFLISSLGYGDRVASLTTISTPHLGSRVADTALGLIPGPVQDALGFLVDLLVGAVDGDEQDVIGQLEQLTEEYAVNTFNPANPDDPRVAYYSVAGVTQTNPFANPFRNDICDPLLLAGFVILQPTGPNDGLVTVESATHGIMLGTVPADHLDEVGQLLGTTSLGYDHEAFYLALAAFLTDPDAPAPL